jgi:putative transcriptional regulator
MASRTTIRSGQLLLAEPFMVDPNFHRAAVLLCEHDQEGSMGLILNKLTGMGITDIVSELPAFDAPVYYGGPVHTDSLQFIHDVGDLLEDSLEISKGVWWGGDFENLKFLISCGLLEPQRVRFFIGCAGWSGGQLEEEMETSSWVLSPMDANYAFKSAPTELWSQAMYNKGNRFEIIADIPEYVSWN